MSETKEDFNMWSYWKEKYYSPVGALEAHYPETLKKSKRLQLLVAQMQNAESGIDTIMRQFESEQNDSEEQDG